MIASRSRTVVGLVATVALATGCLPERVAFSPDGSRYAATSVSGARTVDDATQAVYALRVFDAQGGAATVVDTGRSVGIAPAWCGDRLFYVRVDDDDVALRVWDGGSARDVCRLGLVREQLTWAMTAPQPLPRSEGVLVTARAEDGRVAIWRADPVSGALETWRDGAGAPALSPDGGSVAYLRLEPGSSDRAALVVSGVDGAGERTLVGGLAVLDPRWSLAWSPDGARLAHPGNLTARTCEIHVTEVASGTSRRVSPKGVAATQAVWSRAGDAVFVGLRGERPRVARIDVASGACEDVPGTEAAFPVGLAPDGVTLAVVRDVDRALSELEAGVTASMAWLQAPARVHRFVDLRSGEAVDRPASAWQHLWAAREWGFRLRAYLDRGLDARRAFASAEDQLRRARSGFPECATLDAAVALDHELDAARPGIAFAGGWEADLGRDRTLVALEIAIDGSLTMRSVIGQDGTFTSDDERVTTKVEQLGATVEQSFRIVRDGPVLQLHAEGRTWQLERLRDLAWDPEGLAGTYHVFAGPADATEFLRLRRDGTWSTRTLVGAGDSHASWTLVDGSLHVAIHRDGGDAVLRLVLSDDGERLLGTFRAAEEGAAAFPGQLAFRRVPGGIWYEPRDRSSTTPLPAGFFDGAPGDEKEK